MSKSKEIKPLGSLLERANDGDESALPALREELSRNPAVVEAGNLALHCQRMWQKRMMGSNLGLSEIVSQKLEALKREWTGLSPSPLEAALVDCIACCWIQHYYVEVRLTELTNSTLRELEYHQRWLDHAQSRYLKALKALAQIRRLALPAVQVNIGEKQVNVVTTVPSARIQPPLDDGGHDDV